MLKPDVEIDFDILRLRSRCSSSQIVKKMEHKSRILVELILDKLMLIIPLEIVALGVSNPLLYPFRT